MAAIIHPDNESERLAAVQALGLLDTQPEERFDRFTRLAQRVFQVPAAGLTLIDSDRLWFKSIQGEEMQELAREGSLCGMTIAGGEPLVIADTTRHPDAKDLPVVAGDDGIRFYAGVPIKLRGLGVGTLCIYDYQARVFTESDISLLADLAKMVEGEFHLQSLATTDELTGLSNRRGFLNIGNHAISMCQRMKRPATLMFFDLDGFKAVNDNHGHAEGDQVLCNIGQILLREFRNSDVVARLGGDEFCVLLTGTSAGEIERPMKNLLSAVQAENDRNPYHVGYSVGTVTYDDTKHDSIHALLAEADRLMYDNKRAKKSR